MDNSKSLIQVLNFIFIIVAWRDQVLQVCCCIRVNNHHNLHVSSSLLFWCRDYMKFSFKLLEIHFNAIVNILSIKYICLSHIFDYHLTNFAFKLFFYRYLFCERPIRNLIKILIILRICLKGNFFMIEDVLNLALQFLVPFIVWVLLNCKNQVIFAVKCQGKFANVSKKFCIFLFCIP